MAGYDDDFVVTPAAFVGALGKDYKGGPGDYDGLPGWPGRTASPNGVPEKLIEDAMPGIQPDAPGNDGEQIRRSDENVGSSNKGRTSYPGY